MQPHNTNGGVGLVNGSIGTDAQIVFRAALAAAERRGAVVPGPCVNTIENDHCPPPSITIRLEQSDHDLISLFEHDLFGKPASTFPDHALTPHRPDREHGDDNRDEL